VISVVSVVKKNKKTLIPNMGRTHLHPWCHPT